VEPSASPFIAVSSEARLASRGASANEAAGSVVGVLALVAFFFFFFGGGAFFALLEVKFPTYSKAHNINNNNLK
jgi:hypothetical protein